MNRSTVYSLLLVCSCSITQESDLNPKAPLQPLTITSEVPIEPPAPVRKIVIPERDRTRQNGVLLARLSINENNRPLRSVEKGGTAGQPTPDARALIQEMVAFAEWKKVPMRRALRWQAKYVTGVKPPKPGTQHAWTSTLPAEGGARPSGWVECKKGGPKPCDGTWALYSKNWQTFRDWMIAQVLRGEIAAECPGNPITWGCPADDHIAISRGLCVIEGCGDKNTWWAFPGQGCDEPLRDTLAREGVRIRRGDRNRMSAKEFLKNLRAREADPRFLLSSTSW